MNVPKEDIILIAIGITLVIAILGTFFFVIVIRSYNVRRRRQKEIFEAILGAQEDERKRIAKDLHDQIGPLLSAVRLNIGQLNSKKEPEQVVNVVKEAQGHLDVSIQDIRRISHNLVPKNIETQGLSGALDDYISYIQKAEVVTVSFEKNPERISFKPTIDSNLFRVIQELINNAMRHGGAKKIDVATEIRSNNFRIVVDDKGKGFNQDTIKEGIGLKSIRNRVELYNGTCSWKQREGGGTRFEAVFNLNELK